MKSKQVVIFPKHQKIWDKLGENIKLARKLRNITAIQLAERASIKAGLAINVDSHNNALDLNLARSVGIYFQLQDAQMENIIDKVISVVKDWRAAAKDIGISRAEQEIMSSAFALANT